MDLAAYRRTRRKRKWKRKLFIALPLFFAVFFLATYLLWGPYLQIDLVRITAAPDKEVRDNLHTWLSLRKNSLLPLNNYFFMSRQDVEVFLAGLGLVSYEVNKKFPDILEITFLEKTPWAVYCESETNCYYLDKEGLLYESAPRLVGGPLPTIIFSEGRKLKIGVTLLSGEMLDFLIEFLEDSKILDEISVDKIEILTSNAELKIYTADGWYLFLHADLDTEKILSDLSLLLSLKIKENIGELEYIDMRFEDKAFYKLRE